MPHQISDDLRQCIQNCTECHTMCAETAAHCLGMGGPHAAADHIGALLDCAATCSLSADLMLRGSPLHPQACRLCTAACERCAESCERLADDQTMQQCAEWCRRCAESCRRMAGMAL